LAICGKPTFYLRSRFLIVTFRSKYALFVSPSIQLENFYLLQQLLTLQKHISSWFQPSKCQNNFINI